MTDSPELLGAARVRDLAARLGLRPTKQWGQNFVVDANTVRRIVRLAGVRPDDVVVEVGPGLGSLTLALLPQVAHVTAVEVDPTLAAALPDTVARLQPTHTDRLTVVQADALQLTALPDPQPTALVANLPYNVSVPVVLTFLQHLPTLQRRRFWSMLHFTTPKDVDGNLETLGMKHASALGRYDTSSGDRTAVCGAGGRGFVPRPVTP